MKDIGNEVYSEVYGEVWNKVSDEVYGEVQNKVRNEVVMKSPIRSAAKPKRILK